MRSRVLLSTLLSSTPAISGMGDVKNKKAARLIFGIVFSMIGVVGILQYTGLLKNIPILQFGIPAVLSVYFDVFSGFIQAFVFSLLSMVYISAACPAPE